MGAPIGNRNAASARVWKAAIERALEARGAGDRLAALDLLASKLLDKCEEADMGALRELGDRLDGKPSQSVDLGSDPDKPLLLQEVVRRIVDPVSN